jgi:hypothetical protein
LRQKDCSDFGTSEFFPSRQHFPQVLNNCFLIIFIASFRPRLASPFSFTLETRDKQTTPTCGVELQFPTSCCIKFTFVSGDWIEKKT